MKDKTRKTQPIPPTFFENVPITPIARIECDFKEKFGVPRQSGRANTVADVTLLPPFNARESVRGIEQFSHLWLIFGFSLNGMFGAEFDANAAKNFSPLVRPPRLGGNEKVGVFASRSPFRPNGLGLSCVKLLKAIYPENGGVILRVSGADLVDGTPIYDIKPYLPAADKIENATGGFSDEHARDGLRVTFPHELLEKIPKPKREGLIACLADDPRPAYQNDPARVYGMKFAEFNVRFTVSGNTLTVCAVERCG